MGIMLLLTLLTIPPVTAGTCATYDAPRTGAEINQPELDESSGLAPSWVRPGVWFSHNDSGGSPQLFGFLLDGTARGVYPVTGAAFVDWEDLAAGPCPGGGRCLYIADVGDNKRNRSFVTVYAVEEPTADDQTLPVVALWDVSFPEGPQNVETLLVHPRTGQLTLVTKEPTAPSQVYDLPLEPTSGPTPMTHQAELVLEAEEDADRLTTGGAWDPEGQRVVIRTLGRLFEWSADGCGLTPPWSQAPTVLEGPSERQGEAVSYDPLTGDLVTTSEGAPAVLSVLDCATYTRTAPDCGGDSGEDSGEDSGADSAPDSADPDSRPEDDPTEDRPEDDRAAYTPEALCSCSSGPPGLALAGVLAALLLCGRRTHP